VSGAELYLFNLASLCHSLVRSVLYWAFTAAKIDGAIMQFCVYLIATNLNAL